MKAIAGVPVDVGAVQNSFPGPAVRLDRNGRVLDANAAARHLVAAIERDAIDGLDGMLAEVRKSGRGILESVRLPSDIDAATYDLVLQPLAPAGAPDGQVLVLARDVTLDRNLRRALVESRQRYKDFVECSSEFAWETAVDGRFVFVSPGGALGFRAEQLIDRHPNDFLIADDADDDEDDGDDMGNSGDGGNRGNRGNRGRGRDRVADTGSPFECRRAIRNRVVRFRDAEDRVACLSVSSLPLIQGDGDWHGARGICRDITRDRERELALERARQRDTALATIIHEIRNEIDLVSILERATRVITEAVECGACWVFRPKGTGWSSSAYPDDAPPPPPGIEEFLDEVASGRPNESIRCIDDVLVATAQYGPKVNAVVALAPRKAGMAWLEDDHMLLLAVANQLGVAIEQATIHEQLEILSRTDSLTGLLNRRAFMDEASRRLSHARRTGRSAAILYMDVNNFKQVNDTFGHARGDELIVAVANLILESSRASDVPARVGGDEFLLWLDETGEAGARIKADALAHASGRLSEFGPAEKSPLGLAIGIATYGPDDDVSLERLLDRADRAMYLAKRDAGAGGYAVTHRGANRGARR